MNQALVDVLRGILDWCEKKLDKEWDYSAQLALDLSCTSSRYDDDQQEHLMHYDLYIKPLEKLHAIIKVFIHKAENNTPSIRKMHEVLRQHAVPPEMLINLDAIRHKKKSTIKKIERSYDNLLAWVKKELRGKIWLHSRCARSLSDARYKDVSLVYNCLELLACQFRDWMCSSGESRDKKQEEFFRMSKRIGIRYARSGTRDKHEPQPGDPYHVAWPEGRMQKRRLVSQLKKGKSFNQEYCLRIYFFWDAERQLVVVGWLPSHLGYNW